MIELIPPNRAIYSVAMILLFVIYLNKSNKDDNLVNPLALPCGGAPALKYGDVNTVTPSLARLKG